MKIPYEIIGVETVSAEMLEPIEYQYRGKRNIDIEIRQPEFTSVCPMTGLPDHGMIIIRYRPDEKIVELKSLKYYFLQFRNVGVFYEHLTNRILDDLTEILNPLKMEVIGEFTPRGGITTRVAARFEREGA